MPILNGVSCTKILRKKYHYNGIIIGITSHVDFFTIDKCKSVGMDDILSKPVTKQKLLEYANKYLMGNIKMLNSFNDFLIPKKDLCVKNCI